MTATKQACDAWLAQRLAYKHGDLKAIAYTYGLIPCNLSRALRHRGILGPQPRRKSGLAGAN